MEELTISVQVPHPKCEEEESQVHLLSPEPIQQLLRDGSLFPCPARAGFPDCTPNLAESVLW